MDYLLLIAGLVVLLVGGEVLVRGATALALRFNISTLVVGVTVVSFGTSAPELVVSLKAALSGHPDISIGNIVGSNIANLALVLGATAAIFHINVSKNSIKIDWPVMMIASLVFTWFIWDGALVRWEGAVFVIAIIAFVTWLIRKSRKDEIARANDQEKFIQEQSETKIPKIIAYLIIGCVGLAFGAEWLVTGAVGIASDMGISEAVISLTVIAFGTSVPELATSIIALVKKESDISIGNLIGSNIFNILGILGITALVTDITGFDSRLLSYDVWWMLGISFITLIFMISNMKIHRWEGFVLLTLYIVYIASVALKVG
ncbi:MAG: calcium/sodium antiporter [Flavobacteriales bacterium]|nr:calcium/sodium antiporter [Flavobacteriales bacterium]